MEQEKSHEGWTPELDGSTTLEQVIDLAFDYRGNTTIVCTDGSEMVAYVFNRNRDVAEPFIQVFGDKGDGPFTIPYARIQNIKFTGKDTAAGKSWEAWVKRREADGANATRPQPGP